MEWTIAACISFALLTLTVAGLLVRLGRVLALLDDARARIVVLEQRRDLTTPHAELAAEARGRLSSGESRLALLERDAARLDERSKQSPRAPKE